MDPIQLSRAKCMFIKATRDHIFITDLGNGWILDIDMKRGIYRYVLNMQQFLFKLTTVTLQKLEVYA